MIFKTLLWSSCWSKEIKLEKNQNACFFLTLPQLVDLRLCHQAFCKLNNEAAQKETWAGHSHKLPLMYPRLMFEAANKAVHSLMVDLPGMKTTADSMISIRVWIILSCFATIRKKKSPQGLSVNIFYKPLNLQPPRVSPIQDNVAN